MRRFSLHTQVQHSGLVAQGFKTQLRSSDEDIDPESEDGHSSEVCSPIRGQGVRRTCFRKKFWNRIRTQMLQGKDEWEAQWMVQLAGPQTWRHLGSRCHFNSQWKDEDGSLVYFQVFGFFRRPVNPQDRRQMYLYSLGNNKVQRNGKPPPESRKRLLECNAFSDISSKTKGGSTSVVITDGAPVYPRLCKDQKLKHLSCNHSKGIFCTTKKIEMEHL